MRPVRIAATLAVCAACACRSEGRVSPASPPDGRAELMAARQAVQAVTHFTISSTVTTGLGTFQDTYEVDCARGYYHKLSVAELTAEGMERGTTQLQGRPRARKESEELHVAGRSYSRYSGSWENSPAEYDDAQPTFARSRNSYAERTDCARIRQEADVLGVPLSKAAKATSVEFLGQQTVEGTACNEFRFTYEDKVYGDRMITRDLGGGSVSSEREMVTQPLEALICFGTADKLVYRSVHQQIDRRVETRLLSYGEIAPLPDPSAE